MDLRPEPATIELIGWTFAVFAACIFPNLVARLIFKIFKGVLP